MKYRPIILGLGNGMCGDDGVGPVLAAKLARTFKDAVQVEYHAGPLWDLATEGPRGGLVIIIDAAQASPAFPVGAWRRIVYPREAARLAESGLRDTHTLSVEALLRLGRALGRRRPRVWIYALAGERFGVGDAPSLPVLRAVPVLARRIEADIRRWFGLEPFPAQESRVCTSSH
jgi:hydrogenase maturation protease